MTAVRETSLSRTSRNTHEVKNSNDPTWNKNIWFGCGRWKFIEVSVWDGDGGCDDNLMPARYYPICNTGKCSITYSYGGARLYLDIELTPDGNECSSSPCRNGGTCTDLACGFRCTCLSGYHGTYCEYKKSTGCKRQAILDLDDVLIC